MKISREFLSQNPSVNASRKAISFTKEKILRSYEKCWEIDRSQRRLSQQKDKDKERWNEITFRSCTTCYISHHKWSFSLLFKLSSFIFFLRNTLKASRIRAKKRRTEGNENKSTVNNRTRCQLPYQINLSPVKPNAWSLSSCFRIWRQKLI